MALTERKAERGHCTGPAAVKGHWRIKAGGWPGSLSSREDSCGRAFCSDSLKAESGRWDSNPRRPAWEAESRPPQPPSEPEVAPRLPAACTNACTSEGKSEQTDPLAALAAALLGLPAEDRARLAALLLGRQGQK